MRDTRTWVYRLEAGASSLREPCGSAPPGTFCDADHGRPGKNPLRLSYSNSFDNKIYIAKQQKPLDGQIGDGKIAPVLGVFTDIGTHPPKPPPLVELQRNPPGCAFFVLSMRQRNILVENDK